MVYSEDPIVEIISLSCMVLEQESDEIKRKWNEIKSTSPARPYKLKLKWRPKRYCIQENQKVGQSTRTSQRTEPRFSWGELSSIPARAKGYNDI